MAFIKLPTNYRIIMYKPRYLGIILKMNRMKNLALQSNLIHGGNVKRVLPSLEFIPNFKISVKASDK